MFPAFILFAALFLASLNLNCGVLGEVPYGDAICQYPCHISPPPSPPVSGYPSYGVTPPSLHSSYLLSGAPPPPPPPSSYPCCVSPTPPFQVQGNCPPASIQSCQYPPPNPYTFLPDASHLASPLQSFVILIVSLVVLF
ncbi:hypothetical protein SLA2020_304430 [Shorea laevis]